MDTERCILRLKPLFQHCEKYLFLVYLFQPVLRQFRYSNNNACIYLWYIVFQPVLRQSRYCKNNACIYFWPVVFQPVLRQSLYGDDNGLLVYRVSACLASALLL